MNVPNSKTCLHSQAHFADFVPRELLSLLYCAAVRKAFPAYTRVAYLPEVPKGRTLVLGAGVFETIRPGDAVFANNTVHLMAAPQQSLEGAADLARSMGLHAYILSGELEGESWEVGQVRAALARTAALRSASAVQPYAKLCVILSGGETAATVRQRREGTAKGRRGRSWVFCMGLTQDLQARPKVWKLAADADALVTPDTLERAAAASLSLTDYLNRNDTVRFFQPLGDMLTTYPTHTNVTDFQTKLLFNENCC
jgi:glycerate 2-kinase